MPYSYVRQYQKEYYRSIFLSDFHIGSKSFDAAALLDFLQKTDCEYLYLAGDIIDGWKLHKRWHWDDTCTSILNELVYKQESGTKIIYLPGNHDDKIRKITPAAKYEFGRQIGFIIKEKAIHIMADGRQMLIMHGDQFDHNLIRGPISKISDFLYHSIIDALIPNKRATIKIDGKKRPFSLAKALRKHGQSALNMLNNFENNIYKHAKNYRVDGLITGHTHIPVIKALKDVTYANCGSWVGRGNTALVETMDADLKLIDWPNPLATPFATALMDTKNSQMSLFDPLYQHQPNVCTYAPANTRPHPKSALIIRNMHKLWPVRAQQATPKKTASSAASQAISNAVIQTRLNIDKLPQLQKICYNSPSYL